MTTKLRLGIDHLLEDQNLRKSLAGRRVALLAHPASMTSPELGFRHSIDAIASCREIQLTSAFGPQHGLRGDKQDNMIESEDFRDPELGIPVYSLYGKVRRPTSEMLDSFDVLLFDVQDVGCRIYTFLTTLLYVLEAGAKAGKAVWVLDRPNPAGRPVEGMALLPGWESFVGAAAGIPMRHGMTLGEMARWFVKRLKLDVELNVVPMQGYRLTARDAGWGWPSASLPWVNPSPNAASVNMARAYAGTVLIEGTQLSEGRGTTRALELQGAPGIPMREILKWMQTQAPDWLEGCRLRSCFFEPTFHKHQKQLNAGFQIHAEDPLYDPERFKPYRLITLWFKAIRTLCPEQEVWRDFAYEYETTRLAIDVINGSPRLRQWVDDPQARPSDFEELCVPEEKAWLEDRREFLLYD